MRTTTIAAVLVLALGCSDPGVALERGEAVLRAPERAWPEPDSFPWTVSYESIRYTISNPRWEDANILAGTRHELPAGYAKSPGLADGRWLTVDIVAVSERAPGDVADCKVPRLWWQGARSHAGPDMRVFGKRPSSYTCRPLVPGEQQAGTLSWDCPGDVSHLEIKFGLGSEVPPLRFEM